MRVTDEVVELTPDQFNVFQIMLYIVGCEEKEEWDWQEKISFFTPLTAVMCKQVDELMLREIYSRLELDIDGDREQFLFAKDLVTWYHEVGVLQLEGSDQFIDSLLGDVDTSHSLSSYPFDEELQTHIENIRTEQSFYETFLLPEVMGEFDFEE